MSPLTTDFSTSMSMATTPTTAANMATTTTNVHTGSPQQQETQKRPASYIKVIDLAKSYNIDTEKVKAEIQKINTAKREAGIKDDSHSMVSKVTDESVCSGGDKKQHGGSAKGYPKRFSAMNGGFNLCL